MPWQHQTEYPREVMEYAFVAWLESDGNCARAQRMLAERAAALGWEAIPDRTTVYRWSINENWEAKADEAVGAAFPHVRQRQMRRSVILTDRSLDAMERVLDALDDPESPIHRMKQPVLQAIVTVATELPRTSGLGTHGAKVGGRSLDLAPPLQAVEEQLTFEERLKAHQRMLEGGE